MVAKAAEMGVEAKEVVEQVVEATVGAAKAGVAWEAVTVAGALAEVARAEEETEAAAVAVEWLEAVDSAAGTDGAETVEAAMAGVESAVGMGEVATEAEETAAAAMAEAWAAGAAGAVVGSFRCSIRCSRSARFRKDHT